MSTKQKKAAAESPPGTKTTTVTENGAGTGGGFQFKWNKETWTVSLDEVADLTQSQIVDKLVERWSLASSDTSEEDNDGGGTTKTKIKMVGLGFPTLTSSTSSSSSSPPLTVRQLKVYTNTRNKNKTTKVLVLATTSAALQQQLESESLVQEKEEEEVGYEDDLERGELKITDKARWQYYRYSISLKMAQPSRFSAHSFLRFVEKASYEGDMIAIRGMEAYRRIHSNDAGGLASLLDSPTWLVSFATAAVRGNQTESLLFWMGYGIDESQHSIDDDGGGGDDDDDDDDDNAKKRHFQDAAALRRAVHNNTWAKRDVLVEAASLGRRNLITSVLLQLSPKQQRRRPTPTSSFLYSSSSSSSVVPAAAISVGSRVTFGGGAMKSAVQAAINGGHLSLSRLLLRVLKLHYNSASSADDIDFFNEGENEDNGGGGGSAELNADDCNGWLIVSAGAGRLRMCKWLCDCVGAKFADESVYALVAGFVNSCRHRGGEDQYRREVDKTDDENDLLKMEFSRKCEDRQSCVEEVELRDGSGNSYRALILIVVLSTLSSPTSPHLLFWLWFSAIQANSVAVMRFILKQVSSPPSDGSHHHQQQQRSRSTLSFHATHSLLSACQNGGYRILQLLTDIHLVEDGMGYGGGGDVARKLKMTTMQGFGAWAHALHPQTLAAASPAPSFPPPPPPLPSPLPLPHHLGRMCIEELAGRKRYDMLELLISEGALGTGRDAADGVMNDDDNTNEAADAGTIIPSVASPPPAINCIRERMLLDIPMSAVRTIKRCLEYRQQMEIVTDLYAKQLSLLFVEWKTAMPTDTNRIIVAYMFGSEGRHTEAFETQEQWLLEVFEREDDSVEGES